MPADWTTRPQFRLTRSAAEVFGSDQPVATEHAYRNDALEIVLCGGQIGEIVWHGRPVVRGIHFAVRDAAWGRLENLTKPPVLTTGSDGDVIKVTGKVPYGTADFDFALVLRIVSQTRIEVRLSGKWSAPVQVNRLGLLVLHPAEVAGLPAARLAPAEPGDPPTLPADLVPHQPFRNLQSLCHDLPGGGTVTFHFDGARFEMEDQRNWSDASFKSYCPPLGQPLPLSMPAGAIPPQTVRLELAGTPSPAIRRTQPDVTVRMHAPKGRIPTLGEAIADPHATPSGLPSHAFTFRSGYDLLDAIAALANRPGALLLNSHLRSDRAERDLVDLAGHCKTCGLSPDHIALFTPGKPVPPKDLADSARELFSNARLGSGSVAHFIDLHRNLGCLAGMDFATHALCPNVHDPDDMAILRTLDTLPKLFARATKIASGREYILGHVGLSLPFRPNGQPTEAHPANRRVTSNRTDPRDGAPLGLAWAIGAIAAAAEAGVARMMFAPGLARQLAFLESASGQSALACISSDPTTIRAFGWETPDGKHLALANTSPYPVAVTLDPSQPDGGADRHVTLGSLETRFLPAC